MMTLLICTLIAIFLSGCFMILYGEELRSKILKDREQISKILEKVQELKDRLDLHKF